MMVAERALVVVSLALGSVLFNSTFRLNTRVGNWLGVFAIAAGQIVLGSIVLSELNAISLRGFLAVHLVFLAIFIVVVRRKNCWPRKADYLVSYEETVTFARSNILLITFGLCVFAILIAIVLPTSFIPGDAAHYHLARAQYWIENQSARHFFTDNYRQVEFPPNTSFLYMWQFIVTGNYAALNLFEWMAAVLTGVAIAGLSRHGGHNPASSVFAGLIYLSLSGVVLQMSTPLDDILTAWLAASLTFFTLSAIEGFSAGRSSVGRSYLLYTSICFGLFLGSKLTAVFLLPVFGLVVVAAILRAQAKPVRDSMILGTVLLAGFILFGSYNYVLNWADFGDPIASPAAKQFEYHDVVGANSPVALSSSRNPVANFMRYAYQVMDWRIVKPIPGADTAYLYNRLVYHALDQTLHLDLESLNSFDLVTFGMRDVKPGEVGFGPLGYGILLGSILFLPLAAWRRRRAREYQISLWLLLLGFGWLIAFCLLVPWTPSRLRYLSIPISLFVAAVGPFAYSQRRVAGFWLVPVVGLAIWTAAQTALINRDLSEAQASLSPWQSELLTRILPEKAEIGTSGEVEFIHFLRRFPAYSFEPVAPSRIPGKLNSGELDAGLVLSSTSTLDRFLLPFERGQSLLVRNPRSVLAASLDLYGAKVVSTGTVTTLQIDRSGLVQRLGPDLVRLYLPLVGPLRTDEPNSLRLSFPTPPPKGEDLTLVCGGKSLRFSVNGSALEAQMELGSLSHNEAFLYCELRIQDYAFGEQIPSNSISVTVSGASED